MEASLEQVSITRITKGVKEEALDILSVEEPLEIRITSGIDRTTKPISVTMRTPGHDKELAIGFLFTEGIFQNKKQIIEVEETDSNIIRIVLSPEIIISDQSLSRNFYTTSSCGVCGKASIDAIRVESPMITNGFHAHASVLHSLPSTLLSAQKSFQTTGGLHASALFDGGGNLLSIREDVGRHNALDKIIGAMLLANRFPLSETILLVSGRASFELVQKAAVAGIPVVAAIGAPSSLAGQLAEAKGISLIGFLKQNQFNIYSQPHRILGP